MLTNDQIQNLRRNYASRELDECDALANPIDQFTLWFREALDAAVWEPNAMTLATANVDFKPSARIVLLKGVEADGFVFFTNYNSRKGRELLWNPYACLVFLWHELERQVRIEGRVEKITREESITYFRSRPEGSRIGAWASNQSEVVDSREQLEKSFEQLTASLQGTEIDCPEHWGGYKVIPYEIEFWQGRPNRLHDRIVYTAEPNNNWHKKRLAP
ncbi:MAG: pyridoxamine 5'-phosphate oxidase [Bacteroidota bacterium]|jgi:pyridoxamine 5'-phosphate oxidase|nr:pyridoxine/pyridoxamine 5'-phosphate oxidase [Bacteroidota bacterium]